MLKHKYAGGICFLTLLCAAVMLCSGPSPAHAEGEMEIINVTENISADTTWEGGKIYRVSGWRAVNEGARLTVEPGAVIKCVNNGSLSIYGEILALGTQDNPIYFTVGDDTSSPEVGQAVSGEALWLGLSVEGNGKAVLEYAEIRHSQEWGVRALNSCLEVEHCTFLSNKTGITIENGTARIENNVLQANGEGVRISALEAGGALIKGNRFLLGASAANKTGINIISPGLFQPVEILENIFSGTERTDTVGIEISPSQDPENRLLAIMFNTFQNIGTAVEINGGGHRLRGNNFSGSRLYAVYFNPGVPVSEELKADIRYNYWDSTDGPRRQSGYTYVGSGDYISHPDYLLFDPWGTRSYQPWYEPPEVSIIQPQDGTYALESAELEASAQDANLSELVFYLDGEEIFRVGEDEITSGEVYGCTWRPADGEPPKGSYLFSVKALNRLGEEEEKSITFNYLPETPARPAVNILTPAEGSHINGDVSIEIEAAAAVELGAEGLNCLFLEIDGVKEAEADPPHTSLTWLWETAGYREAIITIRAGAVDILGQENSARVSVCLDRTPPGPVSLYQPSRGQSGVGLPVTFSWEAAESLSPPRYRLQLAAWESGLSESEAFLAPLLDIGGLPGNCYTLRDFPLQSGKRYLWRVQALDLAGNRGPWSEAREFRTFYNTVPADDYIVDNKDRPEQENISSDELEETPEQETGSVFTDITKIFGDLEPGHPAAEAILYLYNRGIVKGMGHGRFAPEMPLNRAQAAALLMGLPLEPGRKSPVSPGIFHDLESGAWYTLTVKAAAGMGLLEGYRDNSFRPAAPINGAEFAVLLCRLERFINSNPGAPLKTGTTLDEIKRRDALLEKTPPWARSSVSALIKRGIIGDKELTRFEPRQPLSRAEAAVLLWKACLYYL